MSIVFASRKDWSIPGVLKYCDSSATTTLCTVSQVPQEPQKHTFLIIFFVCKYLVSTTLTLTKCHMWHLCRQLRKPGLFSSISCSIKQVRDNLPALSGRLDNQYLGGGIGLILSMTGLENGFKLVDPPPSPCLLDRESPIVSTVVTSLE